MKRATTIKDIAKELGISPSTVSRALKDHFEISEETKKAVREVAEKLNYQPNTLAMSLRYSRSHTIGVVIPEIVHFFFSTTISGIEDVAQSHGYNVIITQSNESYEREVTNLQTLFNTRVDGVLVSLSKETKDTSHFKSLIQKGLPIVFFDRVPKDIDSSKVTVDDFHGGFLATEHLIKQGYQKIAQLAGPSNLEITRNRINGYKSAHARHDRQIDTSLILLDSSTDEGQSYRATLEVIKEKGVDAIFASTDLAAMGAIKAARDLKLKVPEQFGVVGFSNWQFTSLTNPTITTIEQPGYEIGQHAAELLIKHIESEKDFGSQAIQLQTQLIERESSVKS